MSPNGKYTALRTTKYTSDNWDTVELRDNSTGRTTSIRTVKSPQQAYVESWSLDSTRILINVGKYVGDDFHSSGFAIIDVSQPDTPIRPRVIKGLPMGLENEALSALKRWKFKPGTLNGRPVPVYFNLVINFQLQ